VNCLSLCGNRLSGPVRGHGSCLVAFCPLQGDVLLLLLLLLLHRALARGWCSSAGSWFLRGMRLLAGLVEHLATRCWTMPSCAAGVIAVSELHHPPAAALMHAWTRTAPNGNHNWQPQSANQECLSVGARQVSLLFC
jgi:hypothetical protein